MSDWNDLKEKLASFALVDDCETLADGSLRFTTPFLYPDGSPVHIFYQQSNDLFLTARLTDGGQSAAFLAGLQVQIENHEKREQILSAICRTLGVRSHEGELTVHLASDDELARGIVQLAQACVRTADILYTQSFRHTSDFHQIFAGFLKQERPDHIEDFTIEGRFGRRIRTDFYTRKKDKPDNLIIVLLSVNKTSSHHVANDVFCRWYDLDRYKEDFRFLTVLDSTSRAFLTADVDRVASVSRVILYPLEAETLRGVLAF